MAPVISLSHLSYLFADGTEAFANLSADLGPGIVGLVGPNGAGKSTLLRTIAGELPPSSGVIRRPDVIGYLPQDLTWRDGDVSDLMGVAGQRAALARIAQGSTDQADYDAVGDDWDLDERCGAQLAALDVPFAQDPDPLARPVASLSGGEATLTALAGLLVKRPDALLLDEPTNNLDTRARSLLRDALVGYSGTVIVVSHDRLLLSNVDQIAELGPAGLRVFGGGLDAYEERRAAEQAAAERDVRDAQQEVRRAERQWAEAQIKLARRERTGRAAQIGGGLPKIVANARKSAAGASAGALRAGSSAKRDEANERLARAADAAKTAEPVRIELPGTRLPAGRDVLSIVIGGEETADDDGEARVPTDLLHVRGPERIALIGPNGCGKTTLLRRIAGLAARGQEAGPPLARVPFGFLPQSLAVLDDDASVIENVRRKAPTAPPQKVRGDLAKFGFRGARAELAAGSLSGGERLRAIVATLLLADPAPQLLLLDEPTNNLDFASRDTLLQALSSYQGAIIVASHDEEFLAALAPTRIVDLAARAA